MKKVLVGLLALAVTTGAFAQGWNFNGYVEGGLGIFFPQEPSKDSVIAGDERGSFVDLVGEDQGAVRTQLRATYVNEAENAGLDLRLRGDATTNALDAKFNHAFGWLAFRDQLITVYGGLVNGYAFDALDRMYGDGTGQGLGLYTVIRPADALSIGLGAYTTGARMTFSGNEVYDGTDWQEQNADRDRMMGTLTLKYEMPDFLTITAGLRNATDVDRGTGFGVTGNFAGYVSSPGLPASGNPYDGRYAVPSLAYISVAYLAQADMNLAFTARAQNLGSFGDYGDMRFYLTFDHTGLVENMGLYLGASFAMTMVETPAAVPDPAPHLWFWAAVDYAVTEVIVPRLDIHYVSGGIYNSETQFSRNEPIRDGVTFGEEDSFLNIRPAVQFRLASSAFLELGAIFNFDLGDEKLATPSWLDHHGTNIACYALTRISF